MRSNHFAGLSTPIRGPSLHRIKTVFSGPLSSTNPRSHRQRSMSPSSITSTSTSPLSEPRSRSPSAEYTPSEASTSAPFSTPPSSLHGDNAEIGLSPLASSASSSSRIGQALRARAMGRKPSMAALELAEEQSKFAAVIGIMEPRPRPGMAVGGIFETLLESEA